MAGAGRWGAFLLLVVLTVMADNLHSAFLLGQLSIQQGYVPAGRLSDFFEQVMPVEPYKFWSDQLSWVAPVVLAVTFALRRMPLGAAFLALKVAFQIAPFLFPFHDVPPPSAPQASP